MQRTVNMLSRSMATATPTTALIDILSEGPLTRVIAEGCTLTLPSVFLRDSSVHKDHLHRDSQQKLFCTTDIPLENTATAVELFRRNGLNHLRVHWKEPLEGVPDEARNISEHSIQFLKDNASKGSIIDDISPSVTWTCKDYAAHVLDSDYNEWMSDDTVLYESLDELVKKGMVFLKNVPTVEKVGQEKPALRSVVERIGSIRHTWYGDLFDVRAVPGSLNIAYTNLNLGLHMDLVHFESPPRYQFLQSLENEGVTGGESYFVDTFKAAEILEQQDPEAAQILASEPVLFNYDNGDHHTRFAHPTIEYNKDGRLWAVNYSPPFQGPLLLSNETSALKMAERLARFHRALKKFADICASPDLQFHIQLQPGDCVIFDNRRVLHARKGFSFDESNANAGRWLKGAYMDGDELWSRWRGLEEE